MVFLTSEDKGLNTYSVFPLPSQCWELVYQPVWMLPRRCTYAGRWWGRETWSSLHEYLLRREVLV
jgi:hypothetical protein